MALTLWHTRNTLVFAKSGASLACAQSIVLGISTTLFDMGWLMAQKDQLIGVLLVSVGRCLLVNH